MATYTHTNVRIVDANPNGLIKPTDLLKLSQEDAERMIRSAYSGERNWKDQKRNGDMRIGAALVSMRISYGLPRSTIASVTGVNLTTITRTELGIRSMSTHSLTRLLTGVRDAVALLHPGRKAEYDRWMIDFLYLVAQVEEEYRIDKARRRLRNFRASSDVEEEVDE